MCVWPRPDTKNSYLSVGNIYHQLVVQPLRVWVVAVARVTNNSLFCDCCAVFFFINIRCGNRSPLLELPSVAPRGSSLNRVLLICFFFGFRLFRRIWFFVWQRFFLNRDRSLNWGIGGIPLPLPKCICDLEYPLTKNEGDLRWSETEFLSPPPVVIIGRLTDSASTNPTIVPNYVPYCTSGINSVTFIKQRIDDYG